MSSSHAEVEGDEGEAEGDAEPDGEAEAALEADGFAPPLSLGVSSPWSVCVFGVHAVAEAAEAIRKRETKRRGNDHFMKDLLLTCRIAAVRVAAGANGLLAWQP